MISAQQCLVLIYDPYPLQLIFTDIRRNKVYITVDEGETYTVVNTPFRPDNIVFQSIQAPNSADNPYNKYVLGYDSSAQTVGLLASIEVQEA